MPVLMRAWHKDPWKQEVRITPTSLFYSRELHCDGIVERPGLPVV